MLFKAAMYLSLAICLSGIAYRVVRWFRTSVGPDVAGDSGTKRLRQAGRSMLQWLLPRNILVSVKVLFVDTLLQADLFRAHKVRWFFHMAVLYSFLLLLLMHAMDDIITRKYFAGYEPTLNPFRFLRNLFGLISLAGVLFFIIRRSRKQPFRSATNRSDLSAIFLLLFILVSGFLLEAVQIVSAPVFDEMVADYRGTDDPEETTPLKSYWAREYGVVFPEPIDVNDSDLLARGKEIHEESCAFCHARPTAAVVSYPLSVSIRSFARTLNAVRADIWLWHLHYVACFVGLAFLPFGKFFHIITVPFNLIIGHLGTPGAAKDANRAVRRAIGMDACTHCGICSIHCSVMPIYRVTENPNVLPSEKLRSVKSVAHGKKSEHKALIALSEGGVACTDCYRCTMICPSGIDLHDLWQASRNEMTKKGYSRPDHWVRERSASRWAELTARRQDMVPMHLPDEYLLRNMEPESFARCVQCTVCANVCPVVSVPKSLSSPEITPQQVMNLLRLDMRDLAMGSRMVWDCMTCYMCQEHCPEGIRVADILYELRSMAANRLQRVRFGKFGDPATDSGMERAAEEDRT